MEALYQLSYSPGPDQRVLDRIAKYNKVQTTNHVF